MDVTNPAAPTVIQTVPAFSNDAFPRNVTVGPDDSTLYVPNADQNQLEVITTTAH
jgi:DNA-binding beta-propeller fold protein YncE